MDYRCAQIRADYLFWKRMSVIRKRRERRLFPTEKQKILFKSVKNCYTLYIRRARSSAGRAPAWHAGGRKFDPCQVHHLNWLEPAERRVFYWLVLSRRGSLPLRYGRAQAESLTVADKIPEKAGFYFTRANGSWQARFAPLRHGRAQVSLKFTWAKAQRPL